MPAILLVRHVQASFAGADYDVLSERGAEQARCLHASLAARGVHGDRLVSGELRRQRDTALPWTGAGAALEIDRRWDEYDAGDVLRAHSAVAASLEREPGDPARPLDDRDFQAVLDEALLGWIRAGEASPAAERWPSFRGRAAAALDAVAEGLERGQTAIVFTSGGVIAACCARILGLPDAAVVPLNRLAINGAVTKVVSGRRGMSLVSFNEHAHLDAGGIVTYR